MNRRRRQTTNMDVAGSTAGAIADVVAHRLLQTIADDDDSQTQYRRYIASDAWLNSPSRRAELAAAGDRCRLCDRGPPAVGIEVHHRTYRNLGHEQPSDLTALCQPCHGVVTRMLRSRRSYTWASCNPAAR